MNVACAATGEISRQIKVISSCPMFLDGGGLCKSQVYAEAAMNPAIESDYSVYQGSCQ